VALTEELDRIDPIVVVHGACIGADDEFDTLVVKRGAYRIVMPSTIIAKRVPDETLYARSHRVVISPAEDPLIRNKRIVSNCHTLIVCPREKREKVRSGTWATYREAIRQGRAVILIYPDGRVSRARGTY
jgi:hypothetical protein